VIINDLDIVRSAVSEGKADAPLDWLTQPDRSTPRAGQRRSTIASMIANRSPAGTPTPILGGPFVGGTIVRDGDAFRLAI
jgi:hypothetical protein